MSNTTMKQLNFFLNENKKDIKTLTSNLGISILIVIVLIEFFNRITNNFITIFNNYAKDHRLLYGSEELKEKDPQSAIRDGFSRAFITILDANITTLIAALILYVIGTGPVKGFAITLSIGIITSMFTAIMCTRAIVNLVYGNKNIKELKIFPVFVSDKFFKIQNNNIHLIGDAFFAFPPSFAQGASQSIESAYELFMSLNTDKEINFFKKRANKLKMILTKNNLLF